MGLKPRQYPNRRTRRKLLKYCIAYSMEQEMAAWCTGLSLLQVRRFAVGLLRRYRWGGRTRWPSKAQLLYSDGRRAVVDFETYPPGSLQWRVSDGYHQQMAQAAVIMKAEHDRLIAAGATWDGMDGYDQRSV